MEKYVRRELLEVAVAAALVGSCEEKTILLQLGYSDCRTYVGIESVAEDVGKDVGANAVRPFVAEVEEAEKE